MGLTGLDLTDKDIQVYEKGQVESREPPLLLPQLTLDLDPVFRSQTLLKCVNDTFFSKIDHVTPDLQDGGTSLCLISGNITISNDDETLQFYYISGPTSGEFHHPGSEALGDLEPETRTRIIRDSAAITHDPALTDGKGSTLMEEDIEGLGHGKRFDTHGVEYRGTWWGGHLHPP